MFVQPAELLDNALVQKRYDCKAATEHKGTSFGKKQQDLSQYVPTAATASRLTEPSLHEPNSDAERPTAKCHENSGFPTRPSLKDQDDESGKNEELRQLRLRPDGHDCEDGEYAPEERITLVGAARQFIRS